MFCTINDTYDHPRYPWIPAHIPDQVGDKHCGNDMLGVGVSFPPRIEYGAGSNGNPVFSCELIV